MGKKSRLRWSVIQHHTEAGNRLLLPPKRRAIRFLNSYPAYLRVSVLMHCLQSDVRQ